VPAELFKFLCPLFMRPRKEWFKQEDFHNAKMGRKIGEFEMKKIIDGR
jgi:hypothetical protein